MNADKDNGTNLIEKISDGSHIDQDKLQKNLASLIVDDFNLKDIMIKSDNINHARVGMAYFDLFVLGEFIKKNSVKKVTEIGCGTSTRFMINSGLDLDTFAIADAGESDGGQKVPYHSCDALEAKEQIIESLNESDMLFVDGKHSYNFAKYVYEELLESLKKDILVVTHDFLNNHMLTGQNVYGEMIFLVDKLKKDKRYELYTCTAFSDDNLKKIESMCGKSFFNNCNDEKRHFLPSLAFMTFNGSK